MAVLITVSISLEGPSDDVPYVVKVAGGNNRSFSDHDTAYGYYMGVIQGIELMGGAVHRMDSTPCIGE